MQACQVGEPRRLRTHLRWVRNRCYIPCMGEAEQAEFDSSDSDEQAAADFERLPSTLPPVGIDLRHYANEEFARSVGKAIEEWLYVFGKVLNLKRLKQVVVSYKYHEALAEVDQGAPVSGPLQATNDEIAVGIAMTPTVLDDGEAKSVMVLNAEYMAVLAVKEEPENAELRDQMIYTLAHECGHVHDLDMRVTCMPDIILKQQLSFRDGILLGIATGCWDEYIACRLSAFIAKEPVLRSLEETFCTALDKAKERADAAIRQYRMHADVTRVTREVAGIYKGVMVYAAYMRGHIDGIDGNVTASAPKAMDALERNPYFRLFFSRLYDELRAMHSTYGTWKGLDIYEPLKTIADELLKLGGIDIQQREDGSAYVDVPRRSETMPTIAEQMAFLSEKNAADEK